MNRILLLLILSLFLLCSGTSGTLSYHKEGSPSFGDGARDTFERRRLLGAGYWSTQGNKVVDAAGNEVWFSGVTWYGLDSQNCVPEGIPLKSIEEHFDLIKEVGFNFIRIPYTTVCVNTSSYPGPKTSFSASKYAGWTSLDILDAIISNATARDVRVGLFWIRPNNSLPGTDPTKEGIWYNDEIPYATEDYWIKTLKFMASRYNENPTVIGMGLFHEPRDDKNGLIWLPNNNSRHNYYRAAKRAGDSIHSVNKNLLIFVQGMSDTRDTKYKTTWWGSGFATVAKYPLNLTVPNKVVYQVHDFGTAVYAQPYFSEPNLDTFLPKFWDQAWGFVHNNNLTPIYIAEFGINISLSDSDSRDVIWFKALIDYIKLKSLRWSILKWGPPEKHGGLWDSNFTQVECDKLNLLLPIFHNDFGPSPSTEVPNSTFPTKEYQARCPYTENKSGDGPNGLEPWAIFLISFFCIIVFVIITMIIAIFFFQDYLPSWIAPLVKRYKTDGLGKAKFIPLKTLHAATNGFSQENFIGSGGFGTVYQGIGPGNQVWAIKQAKNVNEKDNSLFENEVKLISKMNHRCVVQLVGFCDEGGQQILVYEFMAKGMLTNHLRKKNPEGAFVPLTFDQRLKIALTASQGLEYLHSHATEGIFHRDIKSDNILLNEAMEGKIADFGLLKQIPEQNLALNTEQLNIVGTKGYIDPEYIKSYVFTTKSDVYSFGIVLLELLTGKPPVFKNPSTEELITLPDWVRQMVDQFYIVVDPLMDPVSIKKLQRFFQLALCCTERSSTNRPKMADVTRELKKITAMDSGDHSGIDMVQLQTDRQDFSSFDVGTHYASSSQNFPPISTTNYSAR